VLIKIPVGVALKLWLLCLKVSTKILSECLVWLRSIDYFIGVYKLVSNLHNCITEFKYTMLLCRKFSWLLGMICYKKNKLNRPLVRSMKYVHVVLFFNLRLHIDWIVVVAWFVWPCEYMWKGIKNKFLIMLLIFGLFLTLNLCSICTFASTAHCTVCLFLYTTKSEGKCWLNVLFKDDQ